MIKIKNLECEKGTVIAEKFDAKGKHEEIITDISFIVLTLIKNLYNEENENYKENIIYTTKNVIKNLSTLINLMIFKDVLKELNEEKNNSVVDKKEMS